MKWYRSDINKIKVSCKSKIFMFWKYGSFAKKSLQHYHFLLRMDHASKNLDSQFDNQSEIK